MFVGVALAAADQMRGGKKSVSVKEAVFPFNKFDVDVILGPEMRSTGEVMGFDESFGMAFAKAEISAGMPLPTKGVVAVTVNDSDKTTVVPIIRRFHELGFRILATEGTWRYLRARGIPAERVFKRNEGRPDIVDMLISDEIDLHPRLIRVALGFAAGHPDDVETRIARQRAAQRRSQQEASERARLLA